MSTADRGAHGTTGSSPAGRQAEPVFDHQDTDSTFQRKGYVVQPFLDPEQIQSLHRLHDEIYPDLPTDFTATTLDESFERRWRVSNGIREIVQERLARILPRHRMILGVFVTKRARTVQGRVPLHQDWWIVDNRIERGVHVWCPLIDVGVDNGCLMVVPGVHGLLNSPYPIHPKYRTAYHPVLPLLTEQFALQVPMLAGSALIYDQRMLHGSNENAGQLRIAFNCIMVPQHAEPTLYVWSENAPTRLELLRVNESFLCRFRFGVDGIPMPLPDGVQWLGSLESPVRALGEPELEALRRLQASFEA